MTPKQRQRRKALKEALRLGLLLRWRGQPAAAWIGPAFARAPLDVKIAAVSMVYCAAYTIGDEIPESAPAGDWWEGEPADRGVTLYDGERAIGGWGPAFHQAGGLVMEPEYLEQESELAAAGEAARFLLRRPRWWHRWRR